MTASKHDVSQERRGARRIKTNLAGRYMLPDRNEQKCIVVDVSTTGLLIEGPRRGSLGDGVIAYIDQLGRVQGTVVRRTSSGFAIRLTSSTPALKKLAAKLRELEARNALVRAQERRDEPRVEPDVVPLARPML